MSDDFLHDHSRYRVVGNIIHAEQRFKFRRAIANSSRKWWRERGWPHIPHPEDRVHAARMINEEQRLRRQYAHPPVMGDTNNRET